jgi:hypothetical protein
MLSDAFSIKGKADPGLGTLIKLRTNFLICCLSFGCRAASWINASLVFVLFGIGSHQKDIPGDGLFTGDEGIAGRDLSWSFLIGRFPGQCLRSPYAVCRLVPVRIP